jgi:uncharacterized ferritin-like protein (DUF455 family)
MEIRAFAERILLTASLERKLERCREDLTDADPGPVCRPQTPGRPENLRFAPRRGAPAMPRPGAFSDPARRGIAHHIMANHELQAVEVMAFVLLAFPDAPLEFRRGLARIIDDEQRHTRMHAERSAELGVPFGSLPVNCYIWKKAQSFTSVLDYLAGLPLTFEGRNLDHTLEFASAFEAAGDTRSAAVMRAIHRDEIEHVRFGIDWLRKLKPPGESDWDVFCRHLKWPLRPSKARGDVFHAAPRLDAGLAPEFVEALQTSGEHE